MMMLSRLSWGSFRDLDQQKHPGLLAARVSAIGLGGAIACQMSLLVTFKTGIDAPQMCSLVAGEFLEFCRLKLDLEGIDLEGICVIIDRAQCLVA